MQPLCFMIGIKTFGVAKVQQWMAKPIIPAWLLLIVPVIYCVSVRCMNWIYKSFTVAKIIRRRAFCSLIGPFPCPFGDLYRTFYLFTFYTTLVWNKMRLSHRLTYATVSLFTAKSLITSCSCVALTSPGCLAAAIREAEEELRQTFPIQQSKDV